MKKTGVSLSALFRCRRPITSDDVGRISGCQSIRFVPMSETEPPPSFARKPLPCQSIRFVPMSETTAWPAPQRLILTCQSIRFVPMSETVSVHRQRPVFLVSVYPLCSDVGDRRIWKP